MTDLEDVPIERHYSVATTARMFDVRPGTVRGWLRDGQVKGRKVNGYWRIPESELRRLGESRLEEKA